MSSPVPPVPPKSKANYGRLLLIAVLLLAVAGGIYGYFAYANRPPEPVDESAALSGFLKDQAKYAKLADEYADADGDLVADAPKDGRYRDVKELIFTEVAGDDLEKTAALWEPFRKHLEAKTGLPVKFLKIDAPAPEPGEAPADKPLSSVGVGQQIELLRAGKLQIAAFSTGQVQMAVNTAGFVPLYSPATAAGGYSYEMEVIVPADSPVQNVGDLKGKKVALVSLSSNSGWKAPIVHFRDKFGLAVNRDYTYTNTGSHEISMYGVAVGRDAAPVLANRKSTAEQKGEARKAPGAKYDAACVAGDLLARVVGAGDIKPDQYRTIDKAGPFPPLAFGIAHDLKPELAAKIRDAFETFSFACNTVGERFQSQERVKFARIDYKKDWRAVREIDAKLSDAILSK